MSTARSRRLPARNTALEKIVLASLDDMKALDVRVLDVRGLTDITDAMIIASGTSDRHVRSIAERVLEKARAGGWRAVGTEGKQDGEWVLVDLRDVLLHVMLPRVREFYAIEELWEPPAVSPPKRRMERASSAGKPAAKRAARRPPKRPARRPPAH